MTDRIKELAEQANAFMKEHLTPELLFPLISAAGGDSGNAEAHAAAVTKSAMDVIGTMLCLQAASIEEDRIDGLQADLEAAVQVAYNRGAEEWARLNYPGWIDRLERNRQAANGGFCR